MEASNPLELNRHDLSSIDQYRVQRQTSVLVILFTDIKGFTEISERRGDQHAVELLRHHDEIVVRAIEEGGAGLVVKHIGDSVMAIFAEPSTAVDRALRIQQETAAFNHAHPDMETLGIRIGLHMGQVAVENQTQLDLVGRHVNRASRVEGLADAGQIYLTYSVFDSARGWLRAQSGRDLAWKLHGRYILKGLEEAVEIYEVVDKRLRLPAAPLNGRRKSSFIPVWLGLGVVLVGAALVYGIMRYQRTEVYFANWGPELTIVDQKQPLALIGVRSQESQLAVTPFSIGHHLLQQDVSARMRNYMEVEIKRGLNVIAPKLETLYMPNLSRRLDFHPGRREQVEATQTFTYPLYDKANRRIDSKAELSVSIKGEPDKDNPDLMVFHCAWKAVENGALIGSDTIELKSPAKLDQRQDRKIVIREDEMHYWYVRTYTNRRSAELEVSAAYIEYKKE
ncbi:MAG: adenylate/guanylate cyclase domain-containing protein [Opitutaceae bacterium]|nr:adenylate/guanylate cyclase domain-containing protein [Opitutaceae bacterium]